MHIWHSSLNVMVYSQQTITMQELAAQFLTHFIITHYTKKAVFASTC